MYIFYYCTVNALFCVLWLQLMQRVNSPPALTADPIRLVEEFPRWLEKVSEKTPGGVILVLDSINRFQVHTMETVFIFIMNPKASIW